MEKSGEFLGTLNTDLGFWVLRSGLEENPRFKQIVAVTMLVTEDFKEVFSYLRFSRVDPRLNGFHSILVGGHVNLSKDTKDPFWLPLWACLAREVQEEVSVKVSSERVKLLGFINSTENPIDQFHLGALFIAIVKPEEVCPREDGIREGRMVSLPSPFSPGARVDGWSKIAHQVLIDLAQARTPL